MFKEKVSPSASDREVQIQEYYLRGILNGGKERLPISQKALEFAIQSHKEARRDDGTLYISHPVSMACLAVGLGIRDDELIATILLHDVCEDCGISVQSVSESTKVRQAVRLMTIEPQLYETTKADVKRRYFEGLLESPEALLCKALDRIHNLQSSIDVFDRERALKNWRETYHLLLPVTKRAKRNWPEWSDPLHVMREMLKTNLNWMRKAFDFSDDEMYAEYGTMSFEKKAVNCQQKAGENPGNPGGAPEAHGGSGAAT